MPASKADSRALVALNQAFKDHVRDEDRRLDEITKTLTSFSTLVPMLARVESQVGSTSQGVDRLVTHVDKQNGRIGKLERWRSYLTGGIFAGGVAAGWILDHLIRRG
jgi:hypothetical protein